MASVGYPVFGKYENYFFGAFALLVFAGLCYYAYWDQNNPREMPRDFNARLGRECEERGGEPAWNWNGSYQTCHLPPTP